MMNPQILIDAVEHGVRGMIVIFDNRRMAAITGLQLAQYDAEFRTNDRVPSTMCSLPRRCRALWPCPAATQRRIARGAENSTWP